MNAQVQYGDSADGAQLRAAARGFLSRTATEAEARRLMATGNGYDEALWKRMASELGWQGLAIPERYGGAGYGCAELSILLEEMGRALLCAPFLSSVGLAATALTESADEDAPAGSGGTNAARTWSMAARPFTTPMRAPTGSTSRSARWSRSSSGSW